MLNDYELAIVFGISLSEEKQKKILEDVKAIVTSAKGKIKEAKLLGKKKFSYPIKKEKEGFYYILTFTLDGKETGKLSNKIQLTENILRYLIIKR